MKRILSISLSFLLICMLSYAGDYSKKNSKRVNSSKTLVTCSSSSKSSTNLSASTALVSKPTSTKSGSSSLAVSTNSGSFVENDNMGLGNPSNAATIVDSTNNYLMIKPQYTYAYSNAKRTPIWTCWHLSVSDLGKTPRQNDFRPDTSLPSGWYQCDINDYTKSGFDRGHMCPSADRTNSVSNNSATYFMTNMIPQAPDNNEKTWANLENYSRSLVNDGNELYIISGPYGQGGVGKYGTKTTIGNGVVVPSTTWKIVLVLSEGDNDLSRINTSTRVIAVVIPNEQLCNAKSWDQYRVSVDSIEALTGFDFFKLIPSDIQSVLEAKIDNEPISK